MINKEEIEEYKQTLRNEKVLFGIQKDVCLHARVSVEKLVEYIEQLEKDKENIYWQGYIKKQQESVEICKICKYRDKYRQLEAELSKANKIIDEMAVQVYITKEQREEMKEYIWTSNKPKDFKSFVKQYFKKKVEGEKLC